MGFLISAGFGFLGAAITNYLLRNNLGALRIGAAVCAGIVVGAIVNTVIVSALYRMVPDAAQEDYSLFAIIGTIGGPVCTAIAAWRWRPKSRAVGDLRG
jgi:uncharacterized membrane protein YraQ (UPF0718 family)